MEAFQTPLARRAARPELLLIDDDRTAPRRLSFAGPLKLMLLGEGAVLVHDLPASGTRVVGRGSDADIQIRDDSMSRRHAALHVVTDQTGTVSVQIEDLGSRNGTWVQGERVAPGVRVGVGIGESIRLGGAVLLLHHGAVADRLARVQAAPQSEAPLAPVVVSERMRQLHAMTAQVAVGGISVLLLGETGVGKEVLARLVHARSPRASRPFVTINCPALPPTLMESELFGHVRGAFTGAAEDKVGLLESADGGTVFLDEVGELPPEVQAKLLRVLEERCVVRVGGREARPVDVRFVSATNRDLALEAERGRFRRDLYFRLNGISLTVPALRERSEEIPALAERFLAIACARIGRSTAPVLSEAATHALARYRWPGNVRELRNIIERAVLLCSGEVVEVEHLLLPDAAAPPSGQAFGDFPDNGHRPSVPPPPPPGSGLLDEIESLERERVLEALRASGGNQSRAADILGISRRALGRKLDKYGIPRK